MHQNGTVALPLTPKQQRFLAALMTERTREAAADVANVSRATAYRWLGEPVFQTALKQIELSVIEGTARGLIALSGKAITVLEAVLDDSTAPTSTRVRAADATLGRLLQLRE